MAEDPIQAFYEKYPHPDPIPELPAAVLTGEGRLEGCPSWCFHVYWPRAEFRGDLDVLIAGCGTTQAAIYGVSLPQARIVAIDVSGESLASSTALCRKHGVSNVQHRKLNLEQAAELESSFDLVISTGVLHHLPDPDAGLNALRDVLRPEGSLNLMVYACTTCRRCCAASGSPRRTSPMPAWRKSATWCERSPPSTH
jgi:SAM-dependent methyltransferase